MKTYNNLYDKLCSKSSIWKAYLKARKGKSKNLSVVEFDKNALEEINNLREELISGAYAPLPLRRFVIRDPKTRVIHASAFRDRIVHHLIVGILEPIYEPIFIYDSYASRKDKGTHKAVERFKIFMRKVSKNGQLIKNLKSFKSNNSITGYVLKADIRHYFQEVDHEVLISILSKKIRDNQLIELIKKVLSNFEDSNDSRGMPLGNYTSQFFANVYLNELDYFIKHILKVKYYIRYVDDFVIFHEKRRKLEFYLDKINNYISCLKIVLHPNKTKILSLANSITFLGYRIFFHYTLLRKRNSNTFLKRLKKVCKLECLDGWFGYAQWANTYQFRKQLIKSAVDIFDIKDSEKINKLNDLLKTKSNK